jgi:hypothetical protein
MWYGIRAIDECSGTSYEHRRAWVEDKVLWLSSVFAIGICAYAVISNHVNWCCVWIKIKPCLAFKNEPRPYNKTNASLIIK